MSAVQLAVAIFGAGALIAWHEFGHYVVARLLGVRVLRYSIGFGPRLWKLGFRKNDIDYQIGVIPLGGYVQMKGMTPLEPGAIEDPKSFINRPRWVRFLVLAAGPGFNYLMAAVLFFLYFWVWPSPVATTVIELNDVRPNLPAATAGLLPGDMVEKVDGATLDGILDFKSKIGLKKGDAVTLHVLRGETSLDVDVAPVKQGDGYVIGISPAERAPRVSFLMTVAAAGGATVLETERTFAAFGALFRREPGVEVGSTIAIVVEIKDKVARGAQAFVFILAMLSVNLGLLNALPVPALDGIKMLFLAIEGTVRKDIHAGFQVWADAARCGR